MFQDLQIQLLLFWHIQVAQDLTDICGIGTSTQSHRGCGSAVGWTSRQLSTKFAYLEGELLSKNTPPSWRVQGQRYTNGVNVC